MCERDPVKALAEDSVAKITLTRYVGLGRGGEQVELYLENSLSLLKARLCNHQINVQHQLGSF